MSEQDGSQSSTKQRRSRKTNTANQQNGKRAPVAQRPADDDKEAWKTYWKTQGQPWRTELEIDAERQAFLAERRSITPDIEQGIYPFKDTKLSRADVEWLLATHENGRGPVDYQEINLSQRERLDLRGADLSGINLRNLPLAFLYGGLSNRERVNATIDQCNQASILLKGADLSWAHLEWAYLNFAHLEKANLSYADLEGAQLRWAHLEHADLNFAHLERTHMRGAYLEGVSLSEAYLEGARLENAIISDDKHIGPQLADSHLSNVNLAVVKWSQVAMLGDEYGARQKKNRDGGVKNRETRLEEYERAARSNRQLSVALQAQGLNEYAAYFAYRAQTLLKSVFWLQMTRRRVTLRQRIEKFGGWFFSWFLFLLAGYGYRPARSVLWYLAIILGFALTYYAFGHLSLWPPDAFVYSLTSFHGRGFFPGLEGKHSLHDPLIMLAAFEAVIGLFIEISFIATFTQRFFGR